MTDLARLDATAQSDLVRSGELSPLDLVDAAIERVERLNPTVNALVSTDYERARSRAQDIDPGAGPFPGVPFVMKDMHSSQAGLSQWWGNQQLKAIDHHSDGDSELGARFRRAGFVTLGKSNTPEVGSTPATQPVSCGPTNNPWDLDRSPSGSSGGSAAAVAAGMVPIAHATDGGGSIRLPAAWNGLVGLKSTRGRIPNPTALSRYVSELVVSRSVRDTARTLDAVNGATDADFFNYPHPAGPYVDELESPPPPLRVGMIVTGNELGVDPDCVAGVHAVAAVLEQMGHTIEETDSQLLVGEECLVNYRVFPFNTAASIRSIQQALGRPITEEDLEPINWKIWQRASRISGLDHAEGADLQQAWSARVIEWTSTFDVLLTPTCSRPPMLTADLEIPVDDPWALAPIHRSLTQFTMPFNVTGQPAISLPLNRSSDDLPVGIQLVAGMGREDLLLRIAARLEQAMPWDHPAPGLA